MPRLVHAQCGFTLIELMATTALIGLLAVAVVLNLGGVTQRGRLDATVDRIDATVQQARLAAQVTGEPITVTYDLDAQQIRWSDVTVALAHGYRLAWAQASPTARIETGQLTLTLWPGGLLPGHAIALRDGDGKTTVCWLCAGTGQLVRYEEASFVFPQMR